VTKRARVEDVHRNLVRFKDMVANWQAYPEAALPPYQRALYRIAGTASSADQANAPALPQAEFSVSLVYAEPGKGAPLHDHTSQELFFSVTGSWRIYFGDRGQEHVILEQYDSLLVPPGMQRGFLNAGAQPAHLLAIIGRGDEPFPDYSEGLLEAVARHAT
jgi:mannose-6-phosphate isomerase-like protein (cupin superfamily)